MRLLQSFASRFAAVAARARLFLSASKAQTSSRWRAFDSSSCWKALASRDKSCSRSLAHVCTCPSNLASRRARSPRTSERDFSAAVSFISSALFVRCSSLARLSARTRAASAASSTVRSRALASRAAFSAAPSRTFTRADSARSNVSAIVRLRASAACTSAASVAAAVIARLVASPSASRARIFLSVVAFAAARRMAEAAEITIDRRL